MNILWCITGAGEYLKESVEIMKLLEAQDITVFLSKAGEEVAKKYYKMLNEIREEEKIICDTDFAASKAGKVSLDEYDMVIVSPATANTVAKVANGIADNLVTTAVSLALKSDVKVVMVPTDWVEAIVEIPDFLTQGGNKVHMKPRKSDIRNIKYLEEEGIIVLETPEDILKELK